MILSTKSGRSESDSENSHCCGSQQFILSPVIHTRKYTAVLGIVWGGKWMPAFYLLLSPHHPSFHFSIFSQSARVTCQPADYTPSFSQSIIYITTFNHSLVILTISNERILAQESLTSRLFVK